MLSQAAAAGLLSAGCDVEELGVCPTPTVLHHVRTRVLAGGIVVTASHNPEPWNGMKFVGPDGLSTAFSSPPTSNSRRADWQGVGSLVQYHAAADDHIRAVVSSTFFSEFFVGLTRGTARRQSSRRRPHRVGVDAVNGAMSEVAGRLVRECGAEPVEVFCSLRPDRLRKGFPRGPEPRPEHLKGLCRLVKEQRLDFGVAFDPDGDRASFVDENGIALGEEATICLACLYLLGGDHPQSRRTPVVVNLSTTRAVEDIVARFGLRVERTPVGEVSVTRRMKEVGAVLGGEGNGGVILPDVNFTRDGLVACLCVFGLLARTGMKLSELRALIPAYHMVKAVVPSAAEPLTARQAAALRKELPGTKVDEQDGLRFDGPDFWVHVRGSNTEPLVRIIAEVRGAGAPGSGKSGIGSRTTGAGTSAEAVVRRVIRVLKARGVRRAKQEYH